LRFCDQRSQFDHSLISWLHETLIIIIYPDIVLEFRCKFEGIIIFMV
jgi:hypothetical protein